MPIYEYQCSACGHRCERLQSISAPPFTKCSACGEDELQKLISRTSFVLKGGGWYKDGYGSPAATTAPAPAPSTATPPPLGD